MDPTQQFNQGYYFLYVTEPYFLLNLSKAEILSAELTQIEHLDETHYRIVKPLGNPFHFR